jgi:hypothetical protein
MSRKNKVNPDHYKVAGRLAPDDLARERMKQGMAKTADAPLSATDSAKRQVTKSAAGKKTSGRKKAGRRSPPTR